MRTFVLFAVSCVALSACVADQPATAGAKPGNSNPRCETMGNSSLGWLKMEQRQAGAWAQVRTGTSVGALRARLSSLDVAGVEFVDCAARTGIVLSPADPKRIEDLKLKLAGEGSVVSDHVQPSMMGG
jgi:hypothetical protein